MRALQAAFTLAEDPQQRFLLAVIPAAHQVPETARMVAEELIPHLNDNRISNDAHAAAKALVRLGDLGREQLLTGLAKADKQGEGRIGRILVAIDDPESPEAGELGHASLPLYRFYGGFGD